MIRLPSELKTIRQATDTLRVNLINGGLTPSNNDTLPQLVSQVPLLYGEPAPEPIPVDEWQPDPLWVFPDPNGSVELKNIKQIYNEDALASSYTYRAIFMINGAYPTTDLRAGMTSAQAITYILSDGTTYSNITGTSTIHTWDTSKDVIDSNGNPVRYIRCYSNTNITNVPNFYNTIVWVIYNLGTVIPGGSGVSTSINFSANTQLKAVELKENVTTLNQFSFNGCTGLEYFTSINITSIPNGGTTYGPFNNCGFKKIVLSDNIQSIGSYAFQNCYSLKEIMFPNRYDLSIVVYAFQNCYSLLYLNITNEQVTLSAGTFQNCYSLQYANIPNLSGGMSGCFSGCRSLKTFYVPEGVTIIGTGLNGTSLLSLILPSTLTAIGSIIIPSLVQLIVPFDFNLSGMNITSCTQLSRSVLVDILNNLKDLSAETAKTITLGTTLKAKLTTAELEIATDKNWTVA